MKIRLGVAGFAVLAALATPTTSSAAMKFGANISSVPNTGGSNYNCSHPCTMWNSALSGGPSGLTDPTLASPITGVVVKYEILTTGVTGATTLHIRVVHRLTMTDWTGLGASSPDVLPAVSSDQSFPARVPITVGDFVALESTAPAPNFTVAYTPSQASGSTLSDTANLPGVLPSGSSATPESFGTRAIALEATVEADTDGDGFGDETQDGCVGASGPNNGCPVAAPPATTNSPNTPARKKCKAKKRSAQVAKKKCKKKKK